MKNDTRRTDGLSRWNGFDRLACWLFITSLISLPVFAVKMKIQNTGEEAFPLNNIYHVYNSDNEAGPFVNSLNTFSATSVPAGGTAWAGSSTSGSDFTSHNGKWIIIAKSTDGGTTPDLTEQLSPGPQLGVAGGTLTWTCETLAPAPDTYGLAFRIDNQTWQWVHYTARINNTGELIAAVDLAPGELSDVLVSYGPPEGCQTNIIPIHVQSTADVFPALDIVLGSSLEPSSPGWWLCDFPRVDVLTHSTAMIGGPTNSLAIDTSGYEDQTNNLTEGAFLAAASQQFSANQEHQMTIIALLRELNSGVAGGTLSNAGASLNTASAGISTAADNLEAAALTISNSVSGLTNIERTLQLGEGDALTNNWGAVPSGFGAVSNSFMGVYGLAGDLTNNVETGSHDSEFWQVEVPSYGTVDFYPLAGEGDSLAWWFKQAFTWLVYLEYCIFISRLAQQALLQVSHFQQGGSPTVGGQILGTGVKSSLISWILVRVFLSTALILFIGAVFAWYDGLSPTTLYSQFTGGPFSGTSSRGQAYMEGVALADKWLPLTLMVWSGIMHVFAWIPLALITASASLGVRMIPKCILLTGILWSTQVVQAANIVDVWNYRTNVVSVDTNFCLPPGGRLTLNDRSSVDIDGTTISLADNQKLRLEVGDGLIHMTADDLWVTYFYYGLSAGAVWICLKIVIWILRLTSKASTESDSF